MAQLAFDHWFNTLADTAYADRCHRKKKPRQRKSSLGNYQVDEDVWALHPNYQFMYIASVTAVNNSHDTCRVTFIEDGETFNLPVTLLRHVTLEDIQNNRCVDYGQGWTERTNIGALITYDRYGELLQVEFTGSSKNVFNDSFTVGDNTCMTDDTSLPTNINEGGNHIHSSMDESIKEPIFVRIPEPGDPTATYVNCPIWNASSYAEAEQIAFELFNQDFDYMKAVQRAQHRMESTQQIIPSHFDESNSLQHHEILRQTESSTNSSLDLIEQPLVCSNIQEKPRLLPSNQQENEKQLKYDTLIEKSSYKFSDQQSSFDRIQDNKHQLATALQITKDFPSVKEVGIQTESFISLSMAHIDQRQKPIVMTNFNRLTQYHRRLASDTKKRTNTYSPKSSQQIPRHILSTIVSVIDKQQKSWSKFRFNNSFTDDFMKLLLFILSATMIYNHLLSGSSIIDISINSTTITKLNMISMDVLHEAAIALLVAGILRFSSILNGPSQSLLESWSYPFAVP